MSLLLPTLKLIPHYIWARVPRQTQYLAAQAANRSPAKWQCQGLGDLKIVDTNLVAAVTEGRARATENGRERSGGRSDLGGSSGLDERPHSRAEVGLADVECGDEAHDLIVETARDEEHVALEGGGGRGLRD